MKKSFLSLLVLLLAISGFTIRAKATTFTDLSEGQRFYEEMMYLEGQGIITGYPDGTFRPDAEVTRAAAAIMIGRALDLDGEQRDTTFSDVSADQIASGYIASAVEAGIIKGFTDGNYHPDETVTRGQMAIFLSRAFELTEEAEVPFTDVSPSMASYEHIKRIIAENLTQGYEDNTFRPNVKITRAQFSAFLARALDDQFKVQIPVKPVSYAMDTTKNYWHQIDGAGSILYTLSDEVYDGWDYWDVYIETENEYNMSFGFSFLAREDEQGYYIGFPDSEYWMCLKYPATLGQTWTTGYEGEEAQYEITATDMTITTPAGTFTDVVEVTSNNQDVIKVEYYAPNTGIIKEISQGHTIELVNIEER